MPFLPGPLPPLHEFCLHLVLDNSVTRVCCQLEMPLPTVIFNFLICLWLLSRFLATSELTPLSNVLLSNWVSGAQGKPDLRVWCSMDPAVSRAQALRLEESCYFLWMISVWYVLGQWNTTTMMLCLWSMWFFFGPEDLLRFTYLAICRGWPPCLVHYAHYAVASLEGSCGLITR